MFVEEVFIAMDGYKKPTWKYLRRLLEQILDYPHLILLKYLPMNSAYTYFECFLPDKKVVVQQLNLKYSYFTSPPPQHFESNSQNAWGNYKR